MYVAQETIQRHDSVFWHQKLLEQNHFIYLPTQNPNFDWINFSKQVTGGRLIPQYGHDVFQVKWEAKFHNLSDARGKRPLLPHTEASDYPQPPKYLALWCQKIADCGGGTTTLAYVSEFIETLTEAEKENLMHTTHYFGATNGIHANRTDGAVHTILSYINDKPVLRFSCNYINHGDYSPDPENLEPFTPDPFLADISQRLIAYFNKNAMGIRMEPYSLLLWDNECIIHSRTTYEDLSRRLDRIFLT